MVNVLRNVIHGLELMLLKLYKIFKYIQEYSKFVKYSSLATKRFHIACDTIYPCLNDSTTSLAFDRHYIYHPAWAARKLAIIKPKVHVDISSSLHFSSMVSAFIPVKFYDFRPPKLVLDNLECGHIDIANIYFNDNSIESLSCMHVVEHIGLGRYGDPLDYDGDIKAIKELARVLTPNGNLLFVVPVGDKAVIHFNAHRIYIPSDIIDLFLKYGLMLNEFVLIPDNENDGGLIKMPSNEILKKQKYACGCFWFIKKGK